MSLEVHDIATLNHKGFSIMQLGPLSKITFYVQG